jgi:hypothetical protein
MAGIDASAGKSALRPREDSDNNDAQNRARPRGRLHSRGHTGPTILAWPAGAAEFAYSPAPGVHSDREDHRRRLNPAITTTARYRTGSGTQTP